MIDYDRDLRETECAPPHDEPHDIDALRFTEGVIFGLLISSAAWAVLVIWAVL